MSALDRAPRALTRPIKRTPPEVRIEPQGELYRLREYKLPEPAWEARSPFKFDPHTPPPTTPYERSERVLGWIVVGLLTWVGIIEGGRLIWEATHGTIR